MTKQMFDKIKQQFTDIVSFTPSSQIKPTRTKEKPVKKGELFQALGSSGTNLVDGYINDEYNTKLQGQAGLKVYEEMRKSDAQVKAVLDALSTPIRSTKWYFEPAKDEKGEVTPEAQEIADFCTENYFGGMSKTWDQTMSEILTFLPFGFSAFEKIYTVKDDQIFLDCLAYRKQTTIHRWQQEDGSAGITQLLPNTVIGGTNNDKYQVSIPSSKTVLFINQREGDNYQGVSILRAAYKHYYIKNQLYNFDAVRQEKLAMGVPTIYMPKNADEDDVAAATKLVKNIAIHQNSGLVVPGSKEEGWLFEYTQTHASDSTDMFESINHHNREIAKSALAQFLELGNTSSGTRNLQDGQADLFIKAAEMNAKNIANTLNKYSVKELVDFNYDHDELYPELKFEPLSAENYTEIAESITKIATAGLITADNEIEQELRQMMGLPEMSQETIDAKEEAKEQMKQSLNPSPEAKKSESLDDKTKKDNTTEEEIEDEDAEFAEVLHDLNNQYIKQIYSSCETPEEIQELKKKGLVFNDFERQSFRPMTFAERKVNFTSLDKALKKFNDKLKKEIDSITAEQKDNLLQQINKAVKNNDIKAIENIKIKGTNKISSSLSDSQKEMFDIGKASMAKELKTKVPPTAKQTKEIISAQATALAAEYTNRLEVTAKNAALEIIASNSAIDSVTGATVVTGVSKALDTIAGRMQNKLTSVATSGSLNIGRDSIVQRNPERVHAMQYSAILDSNTTNLCLSLDGRVVALGSQDYINFSPPNHIGCRSVWVAILKDEINPPKIKDIPKSIKPSPTLETAVQPSKPLVLKNSLAADQAKENEKLDK